MAANGLESVLGWEFKDPKLLEQALVHRSFVNEHGWSPADSYERLEFLGDAVLELAISQELYCRQPGLSEGALTKSRAALVCQDTLAQVAQRLDLSSFLLLGKGEETSGGRQRDTILAAAFEAVVAAIYLDAGFDTARCFIQRAMGQDLDNFFRLGTPPENPKSHLQEYIQASGRTTPHYRLISAEGPDHGPVFTVEVVVDNEVVGTGRGGSKALAEKTAAENALARLGALAGPTAGG